MSITSTLQDTKARLDGLLNYANETTGQSDVSVGDAIKTLADGYGGGGGLFSDNVYAYGTCSATKNITERQTPFYLSIPVGSYMILRYFEKNVSTPSRPVVMGTTCMIGQPTTATTVAGVNAQAIYTINTGVMSWYTITASHIGVSHSQQVVQIKIPAQAVSVPSDGYDMEFELIVPYAENNVLRFHSDKINLGSVPLDTWTQVSNVGNVYFGWTNPTI